MIRYITISELAKNLKTTEQSIRNWMKQGLPSLKIGRLRRFDPEAVQKWIDDQNKE